MFNKAKNKSAKVNECYVKIGDWISWSWELSEGLVSINEVKEFEELMKLLQFVRIKEEDDRWGWSGTTKGGFNVKMVREELEWAGADQVEYLRIWNNWDVPKVNVFIWRAGLGRLATSDNLQRRGVHMESYSCPVCGTTMESTDHLLVSCSFARVVWGQVCVWLNLPLVGNGGSIMELLHELVSSVKEEKRKKMVQAIGMLTSWCLWMNRNNKVFKRIAGSESKVIDEVKEISYMWLKYRVMMESVSWEMWCRGNLVV
ncbi:hypothetical protein E3N88_36690 [Mikania micrantha]|uniref:Reverse transcriptase zinc-binding domain-containing protein n=1 Tax=Mikania micrantha TaxID=192012 RepID=A0A5N6M4D3_9ASTR|nr:hypothetical protein E3N88_36690 [Mikania micrantha]